MTLNIWRFTDGKPGHDSQSLGLCNAIGKLTSSECFDIPISPFIKNLGHFLYKTFPAGKALPDPDFIIGAGHGTHLSMLAARHVRKGKTIVLMKPSLPLSFFNLCIIPKHDLVPEKTHVITTSGAINPIQFNPKKSTDHGLILIGGASRHYYWNDASIIEQIDAIINKAPELTWAIADSPRTPNNVLAKLHERNYKNTTILNFTDTNKEKLHEYIYKTNDIWVTQDSISMIYESLSSGATVGLIQLPNNGDSRIEQGINMLIEEKTLTSFNSWKKNGALQQNLIKFNEATRCAEILLKKFKPN